MQNSLIELMIELLTKLQIFQLIFYSKKKWRELYGLLSMNSLTLGGHFVFDAFSNHLNLEFII